MVNALIMRCECLYSLLFILDLVKEDCYYNVIVNKEKLSPDLVSISYCVWDVVLQRV